jgi:hypothetical protein
VESQDPREPVRQRTGFRLSAESVSRVCEEPLVLAPTVVSADGIRGPLRLFRRSFFQLRDHELNCFLELWIVSGDHVGRRLLARSLSFRARCVELRHSVQDDAEPIGSGVSGNKMLPVPRSDEEL